MTVTAGWIMVPWKIVYSAASLLNFMTGLAVFLCPIAAIMATDYWLVKHRHIDVPGLYRRHGRYRYRYGINWRAVAALLVSLVPNLPGYVWLMLTKMFAEHIPLTQIQPRKRRQL